MIPNNSNREEPAIAQTPQPSPANVLARIADIRQSINDVAQDPAVLELVCSGTYHPDLRMGDAIQALDELAYALSEFEQRNIAPLPRLATKSGVLVSLKLHQA
ncbi:hypothetical protein H6G27_36060 [Nostoc linckia FACHB-104]|nr:hypothetical protein [Nostoc linckia FACHB-104]